MHGDEARFVKIDGKASGSREVLKHAFEGGSRSGCSSAEDKGIVGILENRARNVGGDGVGKLSFSPGQANEFLEDVSDNNSKAKLKLSHSITSKISCNLGAKEILDDRLPHPGRHAKKI
jgi:hypothetical protein